MSTTRNKIGTVGVDSGQLMIIDPCYIDSAWESKPPKPNGHHSTSYLEIMDATLGSPPYGPVLKYPKGVTGLGFAFSTYWGDGEYTIWETRNERGELLKVEIELASENPPEDEDDFEDEDDYEGGSDYDDEDEEDLDDED